MTQAVQLMSSSLFPNTIQKLGNVQGQMANRPPRVKIGKPSPQQTLRKSAKQNVISALNAKALSLRLDVNIDLQSLKAKGLPLA